MPYNLLRESWIPVLCQSGQIRWIRPDQITDTNDPPIRIQTGSPAFDSAALQYLIGLTQTCHTPQYSQDWMELNAYPPTQDALLSWFQPAEPAMNLDGNGPRFLQDPDVEADLQAKANLEAKKDAAEDDEDAEIAQQPIERILPGSASVNAIKQNLSLFVKPGLIDHLGPAAVALCLMARQWCLPAEGRGFFCPLRGRAPVTVTLQGATLWQTVWLNTVIKSVWAGQPGKHSDEFDIESIFPWMGARLTETTSPTAWDSRHVFWTQPKRIWILWNDQGKGKCDMFGTDGPVASTYSQCGHGIRYTEGFRHPLTFYMQGKANSRYAIISSPDLLRYDYWLGIVAKEGNVVPLALEDDSKGFDNRHLVPLHISGILANNANILGWVEAEMPILVGDKADDWKASIRILIDYASEQAAKLKVRTLAVTNPDGRNTQEKLAGGSTRRFWQQTHLMFDQMAGEIIQVCTQSASEAGQQELRGKWAASCHKACMLAFDAATERYQSPRHQRKMVENRLLLRRSTGPNDKKNAQRLGINTLLKEAIV